VSLIIISLLYSNILGYLSLSCFHSIARHSNKNPNEDYRMIHSVVIICCGIRYLIVSVTSVCINTFPYCGSGQCTVVK
jgi:hypothetical protein